MAAEEGGGVALVLYGSPFCIFLSNLEREREEREKRKGGCKKREWRIIWLRFRWSWERGILVCRASHVVLCSTTYI